VERLGFDALQGGVLISKVASVSKRYENSRRHRKYLILHT
jgi:hypothetical protein